MDHAEYERMYRMEDRHWWFRAKRELVAKALAREAGGRRLRILDAGCGTGKVAEEFRRFGDVVSLDLFPEAMDFCKERKLGGLVQGSCTDLPFADGAFDVVIALDILEHIEHDQQAMTEFQRVVRPGGAVIVTVPAHPFLWSYHDEFLHHFRRYTRTELAAKTQAAGLRADKYTYWNAALFPAVALFRAMRGRKADKPTGTDTDQVPPAWLNAAVLAYLRLENRITAAWGQAFGVSLYGVFRKRALVAQGSAA